MRGSVGCRRRQLVRKAGVGLSGTDSARCCPVSGCRFRRGVAPVALRTILRLDGVAALALRDHVLRGHGWAVRVSDVSGNERLRGAAPGRLVSGHDLAGSRSRSPAACGAIFALLSTTTRLSDDSGQPEVLAWVRPESREGTQKKISQTGSEEDSQPGPGSLSPGWSSRLQRYTARAAFGNPTCSPRVRPAGIVQRPFRRRLLPCVLRCHTPRRRHSWALPAGPEHRS